MRSRMVRSPQRSEPRRDKSPGDLYREKLRLSDGRPPRRAHVPRTSGPQSDLRCPPVETNGGDKEIPMTSRPTSKFGLGLAALSALALPFATPASAEPKKEFN